MTAKKIVVGLDGSRGSNAALAWAIDAAGALGAEIIAVHVVKPIARPAFAAAVPDRPLHESDRMPSDLCSRAVLAFLGPLPTSGIEHRIVTIQGHPATKILRVADDEGAALVVVGKALHSTMAEIFLGSVAHELTHHARRPLVIVPAHAPATDVEALGKKQRAGAGETLAAHDHVLTGVAGTRLRY
jgi:nucleotide-binding universal stress UspA family protein